MKYFTVQEHTKADKSFYIDGPDIQLEVDYDDVDHNTVDRRTQQVVDILNKYWEE